MTVKHSDIFQSPSFRQLRRQRALISWGFAIPLISAYMTFCLLCVYATDWLGSAVGSSPHITWALVLAYSLMAMSILAAIAYVWISNRYLEPNREKLISEIGE